MSRVKNFDPEKLYLCSRLEDKMERITNYPLTVIESPMGYGKTTSMRTFVKAHRIMYVWQSVLNSSREYFWESFCRMFRQIDSEVSDQLMAAGYPKDPVMAGMIISLMNNANYPGDILFIIDDYQLVASEALDAFFETLARAEIQKIHFVLLGRSRCLKNREELKLKGVLYVINEDDLRLDIKEAGQYMENCGLKTEPDDLSDIYRYSEGWISALYMVMLGYAETGEVKKQASLDELFESALYSHYDDMQKDLLLRICLFNRFTLEQAQTVRPEKDTSELLDGIVSSNGFIRYDANMKNYHIHGLFSKYLRDKLAARDPEYRREVYMRAADWHYSNEEYFLATLYYYRSNAYEKMLRSFEMDKGKSLSGRSRHIIMEAYNACPPEIRRKYPMALMILAVQLSMTNQHDHFKSVMSELRNIFRDERSTETRNELLGEYYMLMGFISYNDLDRIVKNQERSAGYLSGTSAIEGRKGAWTFGAPSVMHMFYREKSSLDRLVETMYDSREQYYRLTDNNGRGGEYVLDAERNFVRGDLEKAEILSFKALAAAEKYGQIGVALCALFLQARIFLLNGEQDKGMESLARVNELVVDSERYVFIHTAEMCRAFVYAQFGHDNLIPKWIKQGNYDECGVYHIVESFLYIIYGRILINNEEYSRLLGMEDQLYGSAEEFPNLLSVIYLDIYTASAYAHLGMEREAAERLERAVDRAMEDRIYMPFVENHRCLKTLLKARTEDDSAVSGFLDKVDDLIKKYEKNLSIKISEEGSSPINMLTKREQEISLLVAEGRTNMEIAKQLNVAEITVKKSLSNIYARLGINNRAALTKKISTAR